MSQNTGGWWGIRFDSTALTNDSSKFSFCDFEYGKANGSGKNGSGGALFLNHYGKVSVKNCTFINNRCSNDGGAIYIKACNAYIRGTFFSNNRASRGAGIHCQKANPTVISNIFYNNFASSMGAGICCADTSSATIINNLFYRNLGYLGGGIGFYNSGSAITNNTIVDNKSNYGGGINCISSNPDFVNNILYLNKAAAGAQVSLLNPASDPNFNYCNIQGGLSGFGGAGSGTNYSGTYTNNLNAYPKFMDTLAFNYELRTGSPCMDAGTPDTTGLHLPSYDLLFHSRINMNRIDIGAYEREQVITVCGGISSNTVWNADTVKVTCHTLVPNGVTLTINPGVKVEFQGDYFLQVNGCVKAVGTAVDSIKFYSKNITNGWMGIRFINTASTNDSSLFRYCDFQNGNANGPGFGDDMGGALHVEHFSKLKISRSRFHNNRASTYGGAIYFSESNAELSNCTIDHNTCVMGGSMYLDSANIKCFNNYFCNNWGDGAAIWISRGTTKIYNSIFANNLTPNAGGALVCYMGADVRIVNCDLVNNRGGSHAGAIYGIQSKITIENSILYGNTSANGNQVYFADTLSAPDVYYSDVEGDSAGFAHPGSISFNGIYSHNLQIYPSFNNPTAGAGNTYEALNSDWNLSDCALYNKGNPDTLGLHLPIIDFGGSPRITDDTVDMGAYEMIIPTLIQQPLSINVCEGADTGFIVVMSSTLPVSYMWQISTDGGASWNNAPGNVYDAQYDISSVTASMDGYLFRCMIDAACINLFFTNTATLNVGTSPTLVSNPTDAVICQNSAGSFTVNASGSGLGYIWQQQAPGGGTWSNCNGPFSTTPTFTLNNVQMNLNGWRYRCVVSGTCTPKDTTIAALLTVKPAPVFNTQPTNQSVCVNANATFSFSASGANLNYLWELSTNGTSWATAPGTATNASYNITGATMGMNGYQYHCIISGDCQPSDTSNSVTLTVNSSPLITVQPNDRAVCVGTDTSFTVIASGGNLLYQWQKKPSGGSWTNATGPTAITATYVLSNVSQALDGSMYRCMISGPCPPDTITDSATLTVYAAPVPDLGPNTNMFWSDTIVLSSSGSFTQYYWSTGAATPTLQIIGSIAGNGQHMYILTVTDNHGCQANDSIVVTVIDDSGIESATSDDQINVFPNPSDGFINITSNNFGSENVEIEISDCLGKILYRSAINANTLIDGLRLDMSGFPQGIYFLKIKTVQGRFVRKIMLGAKK
jgi:predicted outer membrane repeat protein